MNLFKKKNNNTTQEFEKHEILHAGYLTKEGMVFKSWKRRWFVLRNNRVLYYHASPNSMAEFKGTIQLQNTTIKAVDYKGKLHCFQIYSKTFSRTYYIYADTREQMDIWIKALRNLTSDVKASTDEEIATANCLFVGMPSIGKSKLVQRWHDGVFEEKPYHPSPKITCTKIKTTTEDGVVCCVNIHEIPGQMYDIENLRKELIKKTVGVLIGFDLTNRETWMQSKEWAKQLKNIFPNQLMVFLGLKADKQDQRQVAGVVGHLFANTLNMDYMEATAISNAGDYSFTFLVDCLARRNLFSQGDKKN